MNKTIIIGRLSRTPELRYTSNNNPVCEFDVAVNRIGVEGTDFLTCVVWNKQAENLVKYQSKGSLIAVEGSNRVDKYQNSEGENRYKHYILVNNIQFLESKKESIDEPKEEMIPQEEENDPFSDFGNQMTITEDALPW